MTKIKILYKSQFFSVPRLLGLKVWPGAVFLKQVGELKKMELKLKFSLVQNNRYGNKKEIVQKCLAGVYKKLTIKKRV